MLSHFAMDAIPHHDFAIHDHASRAYLRLLVLDAVACFILVALLVYGQPRHWLLAVLCAFLAAAPDFMWVKQFWRARKGVEQPVMRRLLSFHKRIQWFERPSGVIVEVLWFGCFIWLLRVVWR